MVHIDKQLVFKLVKKAKIAEEYQCSIKNCQKYKKVTQPQTRNPKTKKFGLPEPEKVSGSGAEKTLLPYSRD